MSIANADIETDLFYSKGQSVYRCGLVEARDTDNQPTGTRTDETVICYVPADAPEGTAEQIARALNRLPKAEAVLVDVAQSLRATDEETTAEAIHGMANAIEEWMCS